jgi:hypothetical protein
MLRGLHHTRSRRVCGSKWGMVYGLFCTERKGLGLLLLRLENTYHLVGGYCDCIMVVVGGVGSFTMFYTRAQWHVHTLLSVSDILYTLTVFEATQV